MDNVREQIENQEEISDAMSQPLGINVIDEAITTNSLSLSLVWCFDSQDDLEAELKEMEQQILDEEILRMPSVRGGGPIANSGDDRPWSETPSLFSSLLLTFSLSL